MINHVRNLLLNGDGQTTFDTDLPADEFVPPDYRPVVLPRELQAVRACLFGKGADRAYMNYRLRQYMTLLHAGDLAGYVTAPDLRVTYWPTHDAALFAGATFAPSITRTAGTSGDLYLQGNLSLLALNQLLFRWRVSVLSSSVVEVAQLTEPITVTDYNYGKVTGTATTPLAPQLFDQPQPWALAYGPTQPEMMEYEPTQLVLPSYDSVILADTPSAYWKLAETSGTTALDSADGDNGTYQGGYTLNNQDNRPANLEGYFTPNGTTGTVQIPDATNLQLSSSITIEAWFKGGVPSVYHQIFQKYSVSGLNPGYALAIDSSGFLMMWVGDATNLWLRYSSNIANNTWRHVVGTLSGTTVTLYVDGVQRAQATRNPVVANTVPAYIGSEFGTTNFSNGNFSSVAVYNVALTPTQVSNHYSAPSFSSAVLAEANLVSFWKLNEIVIPAGATVADSKDANPGTVKGGISGWQPAPPGLQMSPGALFNGSTGAIHVPTASNLHPTAAISLEAWFKLTATDSNHHTIVEAGFTSQTSPYIDYILGINNANQVKFNINVGGSLPLLVSGTLAAGVWYHVVGTYDGANMRLYINGLLTVGPTAVTGAIVNTNQLIAIAQAYRGGYNGESFNGMLSSIAVYNYALSQNKVNAHFRASGAVGTPSAGPPAYVGSATAYSGAVNTSVTKSVTAGNFLLIAAYGNATNASPAALSDTLSNFWVPLAEKVSSQTFRVWGAIANATGSTTVNVIFNNNFSFPIGILFAEYSGVSLDMDGTPVGFAGGAVFPTIVTTNSTDAVLISALDIVNYGGSVLSPADMTIRKAENGGSFLADRFVTATGTYGGETLSGGPSSVGTGVVMALKAVPGTPIGLIATPSQAQVALSWNAVTSATSYDVLRSITSGGETLLINVAGTSYTDTGVVAGITYYYKVRALLGTTVGNSSAEVSATVPLPTTQPPTTQPPTTQPPTTQPPGTTVLQLMGPIPLAGPVGCMFRAASGSQWIVQVLARPFYSLADVVVALDNVMAEDVRLAMFGRRPYVEPYKTFVNLWDRQRVLPYRLGAALLALAYRTDEIRTGA